MLQLVEHRQMNVIVHHIQLRRGPLEPPGDENEEEMEIIDDEEDNGHYYDDADKEDTQIDVELTYLDTAQHGAFEILQS